MWLFVQNCQLSETRGDSFRKKGIWSRVMEQVRNGKQRMDCENVASEWCPFKIKWTRAFQCQASGGGVGRGWAQGALRIGEGGVGMSSQRLDTAPVSLASMWLCSHGWQIGVGDSGSGISEFLGMSLWPCDDTVVQTLTLKVMSITSKECMYSLVRRDWPNLKNTEEGWAGKVGVWAEGGTSQARVPNWKKNISIRVWEGLERRN